MENEDKNQRGEKDKKKKLAFEERKVGKGENRERKTNKEN